MQAGLVHDEGGYECADPGDNGSPVDGQSRVLCPVSGEAKPWKKPVLGDNDGAYWRQHQPHQPYEIQQFGKDEGKAGDDGGNDAGKVYKYIYVSTLPQGDYPGEFSDVTIQYSDGISDKNGPVCHGDCDFYKENGYLE